MDTVSHQMWYRIHSSGTFLAKSRHSSGYYVALGTLSCSPVARCRMYRMSYIPQDIRVGFKFCLRHFIISFGKDIYHNFVIVLFNSKGIKELYYRTGCKYILLLFQAFTIDLNRNTDVHYTSICPKGTINNTRTSLQSIISSYYWIKIKKRITV